MKQNDDTGKTKTKDDTATTKANRAVDDEIKAAAWQALREALLRKAVRDTRRSGC